MYLKLNRGIPTSHPQRNINTCYHSFPPPPPPKHYSDELVDNWIKSRLAGVIQECDRAMQTFEPSAATTALQSFFIDDFCDVYVEYAKMFLGHEANKVSKQVFK